MNFILIILIFIFVISIGIVHGLEPAHGWPIALLYSSERTNYYKASFLSSSIIAIANVISNIIIIFIFILSSFFLQMEKYMMNIIALAILMIMAILSIKNYFIRKEKLNSRNNDETDINSNSYNTDYYNNILISAYFQEHFTKHPYSLKSIFIFGFLLGFLNQEELAILGIAFTGINPYLLILVYTLSVYFSFIIITLWSIKKYEILKEGNKLKKILPIINFLNFIILAILIILDLASMI